MGQPVVHFEVVGKDGEKLQSYFSELFDWNINADNPMNYGLVEQYKNELGMWIGGGVGPGPDQNYPGHVTFYVEVPDVEEYLGKAESLGGSRMMGPDKLESPRGEIVLGQFKDPEGHLIGLVQTAT